MQKIEDVLALTQLSECEWEGSPACSRLERTFGGQILAQACRSAQLFHAHHGAQESSFRVHSLHCYFVEAAQASAPLHLQVEQLRKGASFSNYQVRVSQSARLKAVVSLSIVSNGSSDIGGSGRHEIPMPQVPGPEDCPSVREPHSGFQSSRALSRDWDEWDVRIVHSDQLRVLGAQAPGLRALWLRNTDAALSGSPQANAAALAYMSDMTLLRSSVVDYPRQDFALASLDHTMWLHAHAPVNEWLLMVQHSPFKNDFRGLCQASIFTEDGTLVASVAQEGLVRAT